MADQMPKPAKVPEPASDFGRVKKPAPDAFSNLEDEPGYANHFYDETFGNPNKMTPGMRVMFTLLMIGVAGLILYLGLLILYPEQFSPKNWIGATVDKQMCSNTENQALAGGFELGGIILGMSPTEARHTYPSLRLEPNADGGQKRYFLHHDGNYQIFF